MLIIPDAQDRGESPAAMSEAQAIEMLSGHQDFDRFIEEYRRMGAHRPDLVQALILKGEALSAGASRRAPSYGVPRADGHMAPDKLAEGSGVPAQRICSLLVRGEETTIAPDLSCNA